MHRALPTPTLPKPGPGPGPAPAAAAAAALVARGSASLTVLGRVLYRALLRQGALFGAAASRRQRLTRTQIDELDAILAHSNIRINANGDKEVHDRDHQQTQKQTQKQRRKHDGDADAGLRNVVQLRRMLSEDLLERECSAESVVDIIRHLYRDERTTHTLNSSATQNDVCFAAVKYMADCVAKYERLPLQKWSETTSDGLCRIRVESQFVQRHMLPDGPQFHFNYDVRVENVSDKSIQVISRKWEFVDAAGNVEEVAGQGLVGYMPVIAPNDRFEYSSFTSLPTSMGMMRGSFFGRVFDDAEEAAKLHEEQEHMHQQSLRVISSPVKHFPNAPVSTTATNDDDDDDGVTMEMTVRVDGDDLKIMDGDLDDLELALASGGGGGGGGGCGGGSSSEFMSLFGEAAGGERGNSEEELLEFRIEPLLLESVDDQ